MKPTVGRIVHYVSYGTPGGEFKSECRAAIVTEVPGGAAAADPQVISLCVLNPTGQFFNRAVAYHDGSGHPGKPDCPSIPHQGGTWHWPERAE